MNQVINQNHPQYQQQPQQPPKNKALSALAARLNINELEVQNIVMRTLISAKGNQPTPEEFVTFLAIVNEYKLNPLTREIYAFSNRGTIQPIVSIDGWLSIINNHPQFDGMEFIDTADANGNLISVTCSIYRKDRSRATQVTEYMSECADKTGKSGPWKGWPARMLRHKAAIQCARYAFGLSGIYDPDEADRIRSTEKDITSESSVVPDLVFWSGKLSSVSNMEEYNALRQELLSSFENPPIEIKRMFSEKMKGLSHENP